MNSILEIMQNYGSQASAIGAAATFIFGVFKYLAERKKTQFWKEFDVYHRLVKDLVEPQIADGEKCVERQAAIMFELRNFKRYFSFTERMLIGLNKEWSVTPDKCPRLLNELELTLGYIKNKI